MSIWINTLLSELNKQGDEKAKQLYLEACGQSCPFTHMPNDRLLELRKQAKTEQAFLELLKVHWRLVEEEGAYYIVFDQCYCPLVRQFPERVSPDLCFCTLGNLKYKFKISLGREVPIEMQKTVLAGDDECRFLVRINEK